MTKTTRTHKPRVKITDWHGCYDSNHKDLITKESFSHPAKMARALCERIFDHGCARGYWQPGDAIVDPFGGIFTTGLIGAYKGYKVVGIELEPRFVDLARANIAKNFGKLTRLGRPLPVIINGDSRKLIDILNGDCLPTGAISSPPYADGSAHTGGNDPRPEYIQGAKLHGVGINGAISSPPYADARISLDGGDKNNDMGRKNDGRTVRYTGSISSPPYADSVNQPAKANDSSARLTRKFEAGINVFEASKRGGPNSVVNQPQTYGVTPGQIGALKAGDVSGAITSPPFAGNNQGMDVSTAGRAKLEARWPGITKRHAGSVSNSNAYGDTEGNINNLPPGNAAEVAGAVTSPPYADERVSENRQFKSKGQPNRPDAKDIREAEYGQSEGQIGKETGETYWQAVAVIYQQLFALLPAGGAAAIVVKDYVRNKKVVPLCDQTAQLLSAIGFTVVERCHAMLVKESSTTTLFGEEQTKRTEKKSFFRRLAEKKGSPRIDFEEVIWAVKP